MVENSREALLELAERVERGAAFVLEQEIARARGLSDAVPKPYTASMDAAMSLASDPLLKQFGGPSAMLREAMDRLSKQFALHVRAWPDNEDYAQWLARFVTAAALRARSAATA